MIWISEKGSVCVVLIRWDGKTSDSLSSSSYSHNEDDGKLNNTSWWFIYFYLPFQSTSNLLFAPYPLCYDTAASVWLTFQHANTILANVGQCFWYNCVRCVLDGYEQSRVFEKYRHSGNYQERISQKHLRCPKVESQTSTRLFVKLVNLFLSVLVNVNSLTCLFNGIVLFTCMGPSVLKD